MRPANGVRSATSDTAAATRTARYRAAEVGLWRHYGRAPRERWLQLPELGLGVRVQEFGDDRDPLPIVFIHGGPNAGSTFAPLAAAMEGRRVVILDRPGCGLSGPVDHDAMPVHQSAASVVAATLDALGIDRADVVGSSFGGAWTMWFALAEPERVNRVVLLGAPAFVPGMIVPPFLRMMWTPILGDLIARMPPSVGGSRWVHRQMGHSAAVVESAIPPAYWEWAVRLMADTATMASELRVIRKSLARRGPRPEVQFTADQLRSIAAPVLLYWGDADTFGGAEVAHQIAGLLPDCTLEIAPGAGHLPWLDDPGRAARVVGEFLRSGPLASTEPVVAAAAAGA